MNYFNKVQQKSIVPKGMGLVHKKDQANQISLRSFFLRDDYVDALSEAIGMSKFVSFIQLSNVGLTDAKAIKIIQRIDKHAVKRLDLSYNPHLTKKFYTFLAETIEDPDFNLERLELEGNKMGDHNVDIICNSLTDTGMSYLNLSKNEITDKGAPSLARFVAETTSLRILLLHYNRLAGKGGIELGQAIQLNETLQVLDLSFNAIGGNFKKDTSKLKPS